MSKKTMYLLCILLTILIGTFFYWKHCCGDSIAISDSEEIVQDTVVNNDTPKDRFLETETTISSTTGLPFRITDHNGSFDYTTNENFNFNPNGYAINLPVSAKIATGISDLVTYFNTEKGKRLHITGLYSSSEENTSAYPNLGTARANAVKNYFKEHGLKGRFIEIFGQLDDEIRWDGTMYKGPIQYQVITQNTEANAAAEIEKLRKKIQADPLILNFANAQTSISLSVEQRQKIAEIARYLDLTEPAMAMITGHTDNTGSREGNVTISLERANFAKNYLVQNGIDVAKIQTAGKGSEEPIASNATEAGRAQNRRTVVTVN